MKKFSILVCTAALVFSGSLLRVHAADETMPAAGQVAPTFTLPSQDGSKVSLKSFRGK